MNTEERNEIRSIFEEVIHDYFGSIRDLLISRKQAAVLVGRSPRTINNWIKYGWITPVYKNNVAYYSLGEVLSLRKLISNNDLQKI
jgi:hypothetical protein